MGCTPAQQSEKSLSLTNFSPQAAKLWSSILRYNFDSDSLQFVMEIQDIHVTTLGQYLTPPKVAVIVLELKKFLFVMSMHLNQQNKEEVKQKIAPSPLIDRIWRLLISSSKLYHNFCKEIFNKEVIRSSRQVFSLANYNQTRNKLMHYFGKVHETVWPFYQSEEQYKIAHQGILRLKVTDFFTFHEYFSHIVEAKDPLNRPSIKRELQNMKNAVTHNEASQAIMQALHSYKEEPKDHKRTGSLSFAQVHGRSFKGNFFSPQRRLSAYSLVERHSTFICHHFQNSKPVIEQVSKINIDDDQEAKPEADSDFEDEGENAYKPKIGRKISFVTNQQLMSKIPTAIASTASQPFNIKIFLKEDWIELKKSLERKLAFHSIPLPVINQFSAQICVQDPELIFDQYKRFLLLREITIKKCKVIAPHLVEIAHNFHLAESKDYRSFCKHIFGKMMHRLYLPRQIEQQHREEYKTTLQLYQTVFKMPPNSRIWPAVQKRMDVDSIYNYKYFDLVGYMTAMLENQKYRGLERGEQVAARKALASMEVSQEPKRGEDYINIKIPETAK